MKSLVFETAEVGLRSVLREWEEIALKTVWESHEGLNSRKVCEQVNQRLSPNTISRASVINFLEDMREMGVLKGEEKTGKGGYHWVYTPAMDESGFRKYLATTLITVLLRDFPEETKNTIKAL